MSHPPAVGGVPPEPADRQGIAQAVAAVVGAVVTAVGRVGRLSAAGVADAVERPTRALARRIATGAVAQPRPVAHRAGLAAALAERSGAPALGGATAAALASRVARRFGPLRFLARRTPMWLVATVVPALHASVSHGADELALVASHLVRRSCEAGVEPDPERIRRATVQLVSGVPVDPDAEPRHGPLAWAWLQRALRATVPFAHGVSTRNPEALSAAASAVEPSTLGRPPALPAPPPAPTG